MGVKYPQTVATWERAWERFTPFLDFPPMLRRVIYTTNSIESLNYQLRKVSKNRGHFPSDEAVVKLLWLAICDTCGQTSPRTRQGERTASIQAQGQGQARRRADHHRLEQGPGPARHRLPRSNQPLPVKRLHRKLDMPSGSCAGARRSWFNAGSRFRPAPAPGRPVLHEGGVVLARGCAYCTSPGPSWSTPDPPSVAPHPRAVHARHRPSNRTRPCR